MQIGPESVPALIGALKAKPATSKAGLSKSGRWWGKTPKRANVAYALAKFGPAAKAAIPALIDALKDPNEYVRINSAAALLVIDPTNEQAEPVLIEGIEKSKSLRLQWFAAYKLDKFGSPSVSDLVKLATHDNAGVRRIAIYGLHRIGPAAKAAIPVLTKALTDENQDVRWAAKKALSTVRVEK